MTYTHSTIERRKGKHLTSIERGKIAGWLEEALSHGEIARRIGVNRQTISNELARGTVEQVRKVNGIKHFSMKYDPEFAQNRYEIKRQNCHRPCKFVQVRSFLAYFVKLFKTADYAPDVVVGTTKRTGLFSPEEMVCTTTLYKYIDAQLLEVRNIDLNCQVSRKRTKKYTRKNKKVLGQSIEERPAHIEERQEFGHFEIDTVIGKRGGAETTLLTLTERKSRFEIIRLIDGKDADSVAYGIRQLIKEYGSRSFKRLFKTITSDNGSEFTTLAATLKGYCEVYFTHPYTSCERGTNENHNRMIRRKIPKYESLEQYGRKDIQRIEDGMNDLPRRILGYQPPRQQFEQEAFIVVS
ncbi:IS30 family transposase [Enterococcus sp. BWT-B8]|uniref:IS30 family transposase n=1 Tax=Enterococcus sp. BWT-B8 TaxID=2885157 RepID=UPI001E327FFA|nr:IS30 family transposase [Enterococcus sp. BWT-B8]MCB5950941.1 IS30 family transposase [Enterococcus sp. BWT-B8]